MSTIEENNAVVTLIAAGKALGSAIKPGDGLQPYAIVPEGFTMNLIPLAPLPPLPGHIRQQVRLDDADSFIAYVKAFRTATTRIFASAVRLEAISAGNSGGAQFTALLDYHEGGKEAMAHRVAHTATYPVPLALEFSRWLGMNGKGLTQADFITFIENNSADVVSPDSASLMELVLNYESKSAVSYQSKIDRTSGGRMLSFQETVEAGAPSIGQFKVPDMLDLRLPVFEGGKPYALSARLEYRVSNSKLTITYHLQRPHNVFRAALADMRGAIAAALELELLTGSAEEPDAGFEAVAE